jgi:CCR4-NOT transcription complex subunit 6
MADTAAILPCIISFLVLLLHFSCEPSLAHGFSSTRTYSNPNHRDNDDERQQHRPFRLITWNLLAPIYSPPHKYTWCDPRHLEWSHREPLILDRLRSIQADVVCLQEVQIDIWNHHHDGLQQRLQNELQYSTTLLQNVTNQHPVSTAILIHQDSGITLRRAESRSRVLLAVLEVPSTNTFEGATAPSSAPSLLYLANVHLDAGSGLEHDVTRYHQIKSLLKRLQHHIQLDRQEIENIGDAVDPAVILCGDFNMISQHQIYHWLETGTYHDDDSSPCRPPLKSSSVVSWLLPLHNAFCHHPLAMTYSGGRVLDYIWTSPKSLQILETTCYYPNELLIEKKLPSYQPWPSANHPSDHVPLGALVRIV